MSPWVSGRSHAPSGAHCSRLKSLTRGPFTCSPSLLLSSSLSICHHHHHRHHYPHHRQVPLLETPKFDSKPIYLLSVIIDSLSPSLRKSLSSENAFERHRHLLISLFSTTVFIWLRCHSNYLHHSHQHNGPRLRPL